jgi:hypothetical protein
MPIAFADCFASIKWKATCSGLTGSAARANEIFIKELANTKAFVRGDLNNHSGAAADPELPDSTAPFFFGEPGVETSTGFCLA